MGDDEELGDSLLGGGSEYDGQTDIPISSSAIPSARYNEADAILYLTFASGREYELNGVDRQTFDDFMSAPSKGSFFNQRMKGQYG